jgi:nucleolar protein 12
MARKRMAGKDEGKVQEHDQSKAVFLGNVKFNEQEDNIRRHFEKCGSITDVRLVRDTATGMGKGFGYVNFATTDAVEKAVRLNGTLLNERALRVSRAVNRPKKTITLMEKKTSLGVFKPKTDRGQKKKSFLKVSKEKQKSLTSLSYQGRKINKSNDKKTKSKKKFNKNERRKSTISKKLSQPKKMKTS